MSSSIAPSFDTPRPPKPRYSVRVGVTGHRPDQLQQDATPRARDDLLSLFTAIETAAVRNLESNSQWYEPSRPAIRLVSSLAEGGDQLAAEIVAGEFRARADEGQTRPRAADWSIDAILPAPKVRLRRRILRLRAVRVGTASRCRRSVSRRFRACRPAPRIALADPRRHAGGWRRQAWPAAGRLANFTTVGPDENTRLPLGGALHDLAYRRSRRRVEPQAGFRSWRGGGRGAPGLSSPACR